MLAALDQYGFSSDEVLRKSQLRRAQIAQPGGMVSARQEFEFQRAFVGLTEKHPDHKSIWLELGKRYHCVSFGSLGGAWITAATVEDAFQIASDNPDLHYGANYTRLIMENNVVVGIEFCDPGMPDDLKEFTNIRGIACVNSILNDLAGSEAAAESVFLNSFVPQNYQNVRWAVEADRTGILWSRQTARQSIVSADDSLHNLYMRECRLAPDTDELTEIVYRLIVSRALSGGSLRVSVSEIAGEAGLATRTLQRRLALQNTSVREIYRISLMKAAASMLHFTELKISDIAFRLGYADTASFSHAFRRWASLSPLSYRLEFRTRQNTEISRAPMSVDGRREVN